MSGLDFGPRPDFAWLPVGDLAIDPAYQRDAVRKDSVEMIARLAKAFSWKSFQPLTVARRANGDLFVVDGQHRLAAAIKAGVDTVPCAVFDSQAVADEANAFVAVNGERRVVKALPLHRAACVAGDPRAREVEAVIVEAGLRVATAYSASNLAADEIFCVVQVRRAIDKFGRKLVTNALVALREAYVDDGSVITTPADPGTNIDGAIVQGMVEVYGSVANVPTFDPDRLIEVVGALDPADWRVAARSYRELHKLGIGAAYRAAIIASYNRGLHEKNRLPQFAIGALA